jgi:mono/diheme cytochrome c family protein
MTTRKWIISLSLLFAVATLGLGAIGGCSPATGLTGDPVAGQTTFTAKCSGCHTAPSLAGNENRIVRNMGTVSVAMAGVTLTDQEVADLKAYIATQ